jgi:hypothetical protein
MTWLLQNAREARGFVAKRVRVKTVVLSEIIFGVGAIHRTGTTDRIVMPDELFIKDNYCFEAHL